MRRLLLPLLPLLSVLLSCADAPSAAAGNSASEAGNALALIRTPEGMPAADIALALYPDTLLPDTIPAAPVWIGRTDESGRASIAIPDGRWSLVGSSGNLTFRSFVLPGDTLRDTIRPSVVLRGVVPGARWLLLPGLGRSTRCGPDGSFEIDRLPSGLLLLGFSSPGGTVQRRTWASPAQTITLADTGTSPWIGDRPSDSFMLDLTTIAAGSEGLVGSWSIPATSPFWALPGDDPPRLAILDSTGVQYPARVQDWAPSRRSGRVDFPLPPTAGGGARRFRAILTDSVSLLPSWFPRRLAPLPASPDTTVLPDTGGFLLLGAVDLPNSGGRANVLSWEKAGVVLDSGVWIDWNPADSTITATLGNDAFSGETWHMAPGRHTFALRWDSTSILLYFDGKSLIASNAAAPPSRDRRAWSRPVLGGGGIIAMDVARRTPDASLDWIIASTRAWK